MKVHKKFCCYIPALVEAFIRTEGDVLELGCGLHSTMFLDWMCLEYGRRLVTYENDYRFFGLVEHCKREGHEMYLIDYWDQAKIEQSWGVALIDHAPAMRRKEDIRRLKDWAQVLVVHDTQGRQDKNYKYSEVIPLFRFRKGYPKILPQTLLLSNFVDVSKWRRI